MKRLIPILLFSLLGVALPASACDRTIVCTYNAAQWVFFSLRDSVDGTAATGVSYADITSIGYDQADGTTGTFTLSADSCTASAGNWCEVDSTNQPGLYKLYVTTTPFAQKGDFGYTVNDTSVIPDHYGASIQTQDPSDSIDDLIAILADTNELQTDDYPTTLATLATSSALTTAQNDLDTLTGTDGVTLATSQPNYAPLQPTTAGRTLDVTATGEAGIDLDNTSGTLSDAEVEDITVTAGTVSDKTGYSISGAKTTLDALNDVAATDIVSAGAITTSSGAVSSVTTVTGNVIGSIGSLATQAKADVNAEADTALTDINLDHLLAAPVDVSFANTVNDNSVVGYLAATSLTSGYDRTTDSQEAIAASAGGGAADWTAGEQNQIRQALGITGTTAATTGTGNLDLILDDTGTSGVAIPAGGITSATFASGAITATAIAADAIGASEIAPDAIGASEIATDAIGASEIATDAIGAAELAAAGVAEITTDVWSEALPGTYLAGSGGYIVGNAATTTDLENTVWDAQRSSHTTAGTFGQGSASVQGNVTGSVASVTGAVGSVTGNVGGNVTGTVASVVGDVGGNVTGSVGSLAAQAKLDVNAEADTALSDINLDQLVKNAVTVDFPTTVALNSVIGHLADDGTAATFDRTSDSLEVLATGATLTAAAAADAVWDEVLADHSGGAGSTAEALSNASAAGDPWAVALPGAYGAGTAGNIVGNDLDATVSSRQPSGAVNLNADQSAVTIGTVTTLTGNTPQTGDSFARLGAPAGASVSADIASVQADTTAIAADTAAIVDDTGTSGVVLSSTQITSLVQAIWAAVCEQQGSLTCQQILSLLGSYGFGDAVKSGNNFTYKTTDGVTRFVGSNDGATRNVTSTTPSAGP